MRKIIVFIGILLLAFIQRMNAQNYAMVVYNYDADGNRISLNYTLIRFDDRDAFSDESGTDDMHDDGFNISVYPNPTNGYLVLSSTSYSDSPNIEVKLYSMLGNVIEERTIISNRLEFNISDYPAGIYFLSVIHNDEKHIWKIVKK